MDFFFKKKVKRIIRVILLIILFILGVWIIVLKFDLLFKFNF